MDVEHRAPAPALRPFLERGLEGWASAGAAGQRLRELPFPGVPLILNLGAHWTIAERDTAPEPRDSFVAGLHTGPTIVDGPPAYACIELRLTALGARRLLGVPMDELADRTVPLEDVLPGSAELVDRLRETASWNARFDLLESFLLRRAAETTEPSPEVAWSWSRLVHSGGRVPIGALAAELQWSPRRLIARFRDQIGLAPKTAARIIRFDRAVAAIRAGDRRSLAELALDVGYFDQAHLNRDFRALGDIAPTQLANALLASGGIVA